MRPGPQESQHAHRPAHGERAQRGAAHLGGRVPARRPVVGLGPAQDERAGGARPAGRAQGGLGGRGPGGRDRAREHVQHDVARPARERAERLGRREGRVGDHERERPADAHRLLQGGLERAGVRRVGGDVVQGAPRLGGPAGDDAHRPPGRGQRVRGGPQDPRPAHDQHV